MKIDISDALFKRLQSFAEPFVDTPETIIARALSALESMEPKDPTIVLPQTIYTDPKKIPSLKYTKILNARIGSRNITGNWAEMLSSTLKVAMELMKDPAAIIELSRANIVSGRGNQAKGFEYIPEIGLSFQRCDADVTFKHIVDLVRELDLELEIQFCWGDTPKAYYQNRRASILIKPLSEGIVEK